jgi:hypothetical protein
MPTIHAPRARLGCRLRRGSPVKNARLVNTRMQVLHVWIVSLGDFLHLELALARNALKELFQVLETDSVLFALKELLLVLAMAARRAILHRPQTRQKMAACACPRTILSTLAIDISLLRAKRAKPVD